MTSISCVSDLARFKKTHSLTVTDMCCDQVCYFSMY